MARHPWTVKELKRWLDDQPDDAVILAPGRDHNFRVPNAGLTEVRKNADGSYEEHYDSVDVEQGQEVVQGIIFE